MTLTRQDAVTVRALASLARFAPPEKVAAHLADRGDAVADKIAREVERAAAERTESIHAEAEVG